MRYRLCLSILACFSCLHSPYGIFLPFNLCLLQVKPEGQIVHEMPFEEFKQKLREQVEQDENKAVLVYVHG